jgi:hypothetical protein
MELRLRQCAAKARTCFVAATADGVCEGERAVGPVVRGLHLGADMLTRCRWRPLVGMVIWVLN